MKEEKRKPFRVVFKGGDHKKGVYANDTHCGDIVQDVSGVWYYWCIGGEYPDYFLVALGEALTEFNAPIYAGLAGSVEDDDSA